MTKRSLERSLAYVLETIAGGEFNAKVADRALEVLEHFVLPVGSIGSFANLRELICETATSMDDGTLAVGVLRTLLYLKVPVHVVLEDSTRGEPVACLLDWPGYRVAKITPVLRRF